MRASPALLLLLVSILACDSDTPTQPEDPIPFQDRPFYYVEDVPEYLEVDSHWLTVATDLPMPEAARSALAPLDVGIDSAASIPLNLAPPGHWLIYLHRGTSTELAARAARHLRLSRGFPFASNAYRTNVPGGRLVIVNRFVLRLQPGGTIADIARAGGITGATVVSRVEWDSLTYILSFPDGSKHTPLEIAAFTDQQPGVDHATPNFLFRIDGPPPPGSMAKGRMPPPM